MVRAEWGRVVAILTAELRDLDRAEDAVQDAALDALRSWPTAGLPDRPGAWLLVAARRRAIDRLRREQTGRAKLEGLARLEGIDLTETPADLDERFDQPSVRDDQLALLFACCHPSLAAESRIALTLRAVGGLSTATIARLLLSTESTMAQRLVRAKAKIRDAAIPLTVPDGDALNERIDSVLSVVYLIFTEGYASADDTGLIRDELVDEAVRLSALLAELAADDAEVLGLHALLLLTDARRAARLDDDHQLVPLEAQDRGRWDPTMIERGLAVLARAARRDTLGPYQLQAAIAAVHARSLETGATNWESILALYEALAELDPSPFVQLNRAVALGMVRHPAAALTALDPLHEVLGGRHPYWAARADMLARCGEHRAAREAYDRAVELAPDGPERAFLRQRRDALPPL